MKIRNEGARKVKSGVWTYKGYTLENLGYHPPDHCYWWQAVKDGHADFHANTKAELMNQIDYWENRDNAGNVIEGKD